MSWTKKCILIVFDLHYLYIRQAAAQQKKMKKLRLFLFIVFDLHYLYRK